MVPGLHRIDTFVSGTAMPLAIYLLEGERWLVCDSGCVGMMRDLALPAARQLRPGSGIGTAVIAHAHGDHFGGNAELLAADPGCRLLVHQADAAWAADPKAYLAGFDALGPDYPCPPEVKAWVGGLLGPPTPVRTLVAGDRVDPGGGPVLEVVHLPGHSPGHIGLWWAERRLLLCSDAILGQGQWAAGRLDAIPSYLSVADYLGSVATIRRLAPEVLCTAHYAVMRGEEVEAFCRESEDFVARLGEAVVAALPGKAWTLPELVGEVLARVAPGVASSVAAAFSVKAHLDALVAEGGAQGWRAEGKGLWTA